MEQVHQVILNMLATKYIYNNIFEYIDTWGETPASIAWSLGAYYATPVQAIFGRDMIFNLTSFIDQQVITSGKQRKVDIDNVQLNARQVTHDYAIRDLVNVEITGIYHKLDYGK